MPPAPRQLTYFGEGIEETASNLRIARYSLGSPPAASFDWASTRYRRTGSPLGGHVSGSDAGRLADTAVADVAAQIANHGKLPPLSDEEREQRRVENELYRWECQQREEQRAFEYQQRQAEAESISRQTQITLRILVGAR